MKKQFMKTTALVAAALIGGAGSAALAQDKMQANKPMMSLGGYYQGDIGLPIDDVANASKHSTIDYHAESEVHFNGAVKLDNGVTIRVRWEIEGDEDGSPAPSRSSHNHGIDADGDGVLSDTEADAAENASVNSLAGRDPVDEAYVTVSGSFGQLMLGSTDNAAVKMVTGYTGSWATGVGQNLAFDSFEWSSTPSGEFGTTRDSRASVFDGDAEKISYFTPRMAGFQVGVSYTPNISEQTTEDAGDMADAVEQYHDGIAIAANWTGKFDMASVGIAGGYVSLQAPEGEDEENPAFWLAAVKLGAGPVTVAAGFKEVTAGERRPEGRIFDVGARYSMGPNAWSLTYSNGKEKVSKDMSQAAMLSFARTLGPGTKWYSNLIYNKGRDTNAKTNVVSTGKAWSLSTGFRVNF